MLAKCCYCPFFLDFTHIFYIQRKSPGSAAATTAAAAPPLQDTASKLGGCKDGPECAHLLATLLQSSFASPFSRLPLCIPDIEAFFEPCMQIRPNSQSQGSQQFLLVVQATEIPGICPPHFLQATSSAPCRSLASSSHHHEHPSVTKYPEQPLNHYHFLDTIILLESLVCIHALLILTPSSY